MKNSFRHFGRLVRLYPAEANMTKTTASATIYKFSVPKGRANGGILQAILTLAVRENALIYRLANFKQ